MFIEAPALANATGLRPRPPAGSPVLEPASLALNVTQSCLAAPFEALRSQYASAVTAGVVPRSLLASGQLERCLDNLEKLCLGPLARRR
ncbi:hypothetical protein ACS5PN_16520 [Roseateles sp. NT4]|uniref:hypothetical protein n=1 Tax=Roseateles sp. NT4 TaxID=3453715 RepID=UPI003EE93AF0